MIINKMIDTHGREDYNLPVEHIAEFNCKGPVTHENFSGISRI
jgi:hypothetical protein